MFRFLIAPRLVLFTTVAFACFRIFELRAENILPFLFTILTRSILVLFFFWALSSRLEVYLGKLVAWKIANISGGDLVWTFERIHVRPNMWSMDGLARIEVYKWTWHNPPGFRGDAGSYVLEIDRLSMRFTWKTLFLAIRSHGAVSVDLLQAEGLRFRTERNNEGVLNLWEALNIKDGDINVSVICDHAHRHGGMAVHHGMDTRGKPNQDRSCSDNSDVRHQSSFKPLPATATDATLRASGYKEDQWKGRELLRQRSKSMLQKWSSRLTSCFAFSQEKKVPQLLVPDEYFEFAPGDPMRRPRWGVPIRFDINQMVLLDVKLWILDLLLMDQHSFFHDPDDMKLDVKSMVINRERLERGDDRKWGGGAVGDGVRGVYLGEIGWTIIGKLIPALLWRRPTRTFSHALHAGAYAFQDSVKRSAACVVERVWFPRSLSNRTSLDDCCYVHIHLMNGRRVTSGGSRINASVEMKLLNNGNQTLPEAKSPTRLWTSKPHWHLHYHLGPVVSADATIRIRLFHTPVGLSSESVVVGEFSVPVARLFVKADTINDDDLMVGWFPLDIEDEGFRGELKLGLRLVNDVLLPN